MALPVVRRRVCDAGRDVRGPPAGLPGCAAPDDVLVGLSALRSARLGECSADLRAEGPLWTVRGRPMPCCPAFLLAGPTRRGRDDRRGDRRGGRRPTAASGRRQPSPGGSPHDGPGMGRGASAAGRRRFAVSFAALAVELGGEASARSVRHRPVRSRRSGRPGERRRAPCRDGRRSGLWRFVSSVSGGRLVATNTNSPCLVVGKRRFMPPVP